MLDKLIDVLLEFLDLFRFWDIIDPTEMALVFSLGRDTAILRSDNGLFGTGFHLVAPFGLETLITVNIQWDWEQTPYQSLTTKDGKAVICQISYKFRLLPDEEKVRKHIVELNDETATRNLAFTAAVAAVVEVSTLKEIREATEEGLNQAILELARGELNQWGYKLAKVEWLQRPESRTYRFMQDHMNTVTVDGDSD